MNDNLPKQSKREFAYSAGPAKQCYSDRHSLVTVNGVAGRSRICSAANSLYRYPSPDRPAYSPSGPITVFRLYSAKMTGDIGYHCEIAIHRGADRTNRGAVDITMIGLRLCKRHQSSSRQWQYLVWQVALRATWNVASQVQALALWLQKYWVRTAQGQSWQVQQPAFCVTTQASTAAAKLNNRAHCGRAMHKDRRWGHVPAAVFSFLGT